MLHLLTLDSLRARLDAHEPATLPLPSQTRALASVALILCNTPHHSHICMIQRTTRDDDRWSGHIALPGGRASTGDKDSITTAIRETHEEVGLLLSPDTHHIGQLDQLQLSNHGDTRQGVLHAHVFSMELATLPPLVPDPREVAQAFWVRLEELYDPGAATLYAWPRQDAPSMHFPAIQYGEHVVWGLTYRLLYNFSQIMGAPLPLPEQG